MSSDPVVDSNAVDCLPSEGHPIDATTIKIAIRNLHAAIAELSRVVEGQKAPRGS